MSYLVLLPVTHRVDLVRESMKFISHKEQLVVVNNFDNKEVEEECKRAEDSGAKVFRYPRNLGCGGSWNLGLKEMMSRPSCEFLIILSPSCGLEKDIQHFADLIIEEEATAGACRYIATPSAMLHCFSHTRKSVERWGYFDENFWPIYYEDTDFCYRTLLDKREGEEKQVKMLSLEIGKSVGISLGVQDRRLFRLYQANAGRIGQYYVDKWGGQHTVEKFKTPFNNPNLGIHKWSVDPKIFKWPKGVYEGDF